MQLMEYINDPSDSSRKEKAFSNRKDKPKQRDINLFSDLLGYNKLKRKENKQSAFLEIQNKLAFIQTGQLTKQQIYEKNLLEKKKLRFRKPKYQLNNLKIKAKTWHVLRCKNECGTVRQGIL